MSPESFVRRAHDFLGYLQTHSPQLMKLGLFQWLSRLVDWLLLYFNTKAVLDVVQPAIALESATAKPLASAIDAAFDTQSQFWAIVESEETKQKATAIVETAVAEFLEKREAIAPLIQVESRELAIDEDRQWGDSRLLSGGFEVGIKRHK